MMSNSTDSLLELVGTILYSDIVTILVWLNASKTLWVNKSNLLPSSILETWHTPLTLVIGNVFAKRLAPTNQTPSPTVTPTTSPTRSPTTPNPLTVKTIPTTNLPLPDPIPIPTTTSPKNPPTPTPTLATPINPPTPISFKTANLHCKNVSVEWTTTYVCIAVIPVTKLVSARNRVHHLPRPKDALQRPRKRRLPLLQKKIRQPSRLRTN